VLLSVSNRSTAQRHVRDLRVVRLIQEAEMSHINTLLLVVFDILCEVIGVSLGPVAARRAIDTAKASSLDQVSYHFQSPFGGLYLHSSLYRSSS